MLSELLNTEKPRMKTILIAFLLSVAALHTTEAVTCYQCTAGDTSCNDPYKPNSGTTCKGETCFKIKASTSGSSVYSVYLKLGTSKCSVIYQHIKRLKTIFPAD